MFDDRMAALETEYEAVETELADAATLSDQTACATCRGATRNSVRSSAPGTS